VAVALTIGAVMVSAPAAEAGSTVPLMTLQEVQERIDVNTATAEELEKVPGIGPATAARIVEWRETQGRFERLEDLLNIRGIGTKTLETLRPYLKIGDEVAEIDPK
jgi:comEA protein